MHKVLLKVFKDSVLDSVRLIVEMICLQVKHGRYDRFISVILKLVRIMLTHNVKPYQYSARSLPVLSVSRNISVIQTFTAIEGEWP